MTAFGYFAFVGVPIIVTIAAYIAVRLHERSSLATRERIRHLERHGANGRLKPAE